MGRVKQMTKRMAGIDAGGTLIKIAYLDEGSGSDGTDHGYPPHAGAAGQAAKQPPDSQGAASGRRVPALCKFATSQIQDAADWVRANLPADTRIGYTGGQAEHLRRLLPEYADSGMIPEFEATAEGAVRVTAYGHRGEADLAAERFILANVGTGTSLHLIDGAERPRLGGIGLGGGTIVGLTGLLCGLRDYEAIARMAPLGDREAVDLTVGQIYAPAEPPIAGDLTAANFARPVPPAAGVQPQDYAAAVVGMVAEIVVTVAVQAAKLQGTSRVVYVGSSYDYNPLLRDLTARFTTMLGCEAEMPEYGAYCGAIGALHIAAAGWPT
ncbi:hypothetical protein B9G55_13265 [Saccharibacillus sp. O16]|nr:hypothetical protein B9G55_13265 [Saccharibacillus sp. O16]